MRMKTCTSCQTRYGVNLPACPKCFPEQSTGRDTRAYDHALAGSSDSMEVIEYRWRTLLAPRFGLDPALKGKARAMAMAKATGLMAAIPIATQQAMREPGEDREEDE